MKTYMLEGRQVVYKTITYNNQKYAVYVDMTNPYHVICQITEIHPYDETEYIWAKMGSVGKGKVQFMLYGDEIDAMQMPSYEPDEYESSEDYIYEIINTICDELSELNRERKIA